MEILRLEAVDMGNDQDEIAAKCGEYVENIYFESEDSFYEISNDLVIRACEELGWSTVPQVGGLVPEWQ